MADNKKYYYLKLKDNFYDSEQMIILQNMQDGYLYSDILMKLYLRSLKTDGKLIFNNIIPYTPEVLAQVVRHQVGTVKQALQIFKQLGLIEILDNGTIFMLDIQNFIGKSSTEADRIRQYRNEINEEKLIGCTNVQQMNNKNTPEIEIEKEIDIEIEKDKVQITDKVRNTCKSKKEDLIKLLETNEYFLTHNNLKETLKQWLDYKCERKEYYKETGFKSLLTQIQKASEEYGQDKVVDLINECMANNYKGIIFDKLKQEKERNLSPRELRNKEFERKLAEGYFDDVM